MAVASRAVMQSKVISELKVSAHLMTLDTGLFCLFQIPSPHAPQDGLGLPGVRVTLAPHAMDEDTVAISAFNPDGWIGMHDDGALVRVRRGPAQVLVTIYQAPNAVEAPKLQVLRLGDAVAQPQQPFGQASPPPRPALPLHAVPQVAAPHTQQIAQQHAAPAQPGLPPVPGRAVEVAAHVQMRGDIGGRLGEWIGDRGSRRWVEGFAIAPSSVIGPADIEYQALLGRGWLSPWSDGGQFCGSRGMALPILGLRIRLRGAAAEHFDCVYAASFVDGSQAGPARNGEPCEAASLSPLEAFQVGLIPRNTGLAGNEQNTAAAPARAPRAAKPTVTKPAATKPAAKTAKKPAPRARGK